MYMNNGQYYSIYSCYSCTNIGLSKKGLESLKHVVLSLILGFMYMKKIMLGGVPFRYLTILREVSLLLLWCYSTKPEIIVNC